MANPPRSTVYQPRHCESGRHAIFHRGDPLRDDRVVSLPNGHSKLTGKRCRNHDGAQKKCDNGHWNTYGEITERVMNVRLRGVTGGQAPNIVDNADDGASTSGS